MKKQKTGFWKTHPLLKAIAVLVLFFSILNFSVLWYNIPILIPMTYMLQALYFWGKGAYILGGVYGIWLDHGCHLKIILFGLLLLVLICIASTTYFFLNIYPDWIHYGQLDWELTQSTIIFTVLQILSVIGGYILSKVILYFARKDHKKEKTSI